MPDHVLLRRAGYAPVERRIDAVAGRHDTAADAVAEDRGKPRRHRGVRRSAVAHLRLDERDGGHAHLDDDLARSRPRVGDVRRDEDVRGAEALDDGGLHHQV